jgi:hypothetical protein
LPRAVADVGGSQAGRATALALLVAVAAQAGEVEAGRAAADLGQRSGGLPRIAPELRILAGIVVIEQNLGDEVEIVGPQGAGAVAVWIWPDAGIVQTVRVNPGTGQRERQRRYGLRRLPDVSSWWEELGNSAAAGRAPGRTRFNRNRMSTRAVGCAKTASPSRSLAALGGAASCNSP